MKLKALLTLLLLGLVGCALKKSQTPPPSLKSDKSEETQKEAGKNSAIFHIIVDLGVELELLHLEENKSENILVDKTISRLQMKPGHWQVNSFKISGTTYKLMNTSKKFIFRVKKSKNTYVGSYIFQCPKVDRSHFREMKKLNFFNRYPFSSNQGLCEMVVGSDFSTVNKVWLRLSKDHRPLGLGF
jgi:hypothetical protein